MNQLEKTRSEKSQSGLDPSLIKFLSAFLLILVLAFLMLAGTRRLNFDEALALRSGWLLVEDVPSAPPFYMPTTLLLGVLGSRVEDPGTVFLVARLVASLSVCLMLFWLLRELRQPAVALVTAVLIFSQSTFVVHGLEFRYDWAILIGLLAAHVLLSRAQRFDFFWLGVCVGWLGIHHLKGLYFAAVLYLLATIAASVGRAQPLRKLQSLNLGLLLALVLWFALTALFGFWSDFVSVYATFFSLAAGTDARVWPWEALAETLRRDTVWWLGAAAASGFTVVKLRQSGLSPLREHSFWTLMLALASIGFLFLHPHPWAYMLTLAVPFLSLLMAQALTSLAPRASRISLLGSLLLILLLHFAATRSSPWSVYVSSIAAPRSHQVASLRQLRDLAEPTDRVIDPSGLAYFLKPCTAEWYLDTLFQESAAKGQWMNEMKRVDLRECPWMVNTYRLAMLPDEVATRLRGKYILPDQGGGLALINGDPRLHTLNSWDRLPFTELYSFW